ncbi:MAG: hypothetical protein ACUVSX_04485 [Aggregatilineales bacterium]
MHSSFAQQVINYQTSSRSITVVWLAPLASELPLAYARFDEPALPYGRDLILTTAGSVCGWSFDLAAYLAYGAAGVITLERTLALATGQGITILHGAFAIPDYARLLDGPLRFDAYTVSDSSVCAAYTQQPHVGVFVMQTDQTHQAPNCGLFSPETGIFQMPVVNSDHTLRLHRLDPLRVPEKGENKTRFLSAVQAMLREANN